MTQEIVCSNILIKMRPKYKYVYICQSHELTDEAVMELLEPWWGWRTYESGIGSRYNGWRINWEVFLNLYDTH